MIVIDRNKLMDVIDSCIRNLETIDNLSKLLLSANIEYCLKEIENNNKDTDVK